MYDDDQENNDNGPSSKEIATELDTNSILKTANLLRQEASILDNYEERKRVVQYLEDEFVAKRMAASSIQERARMKALEAVIRRLDDPNLPFQQVLKALEVINANGSDIGAIMAKHAPKGGTGLNVQINNGNSPQVYADGNKPEEGKKLGYDNTMKDTGQVIEALKFISQDVDPSTLKNMRQDINKEED